VVATPCTINGFRLLDTKILIYLANIAAPQHSAAMEAVTSLRFGGDRLAITAQVLFEFWSVATRPVSVNGLGWTADQTRAAIDGFRGRFELLPEVPAVIDVWIELVTKHDLKGKRVHDAHLLATMKANGVSRLLTLNAADFPADPTLTILTLGPAGQMLPSRRARPND
jgi:predicted nucleic acid-binding protein